MKTRLICPKCILNDHKDSFWVECTDEEVIQCILPFVADKKDELIEQVNIYRGHSKINENQNEHIYCNFFLISTDLKEIKSYDWVMPYGGMWNGGNPFRSIEVVDFYSLEELKVMWKKVKRK
jgi:hypothetical protein